MLEHIPGLPDLILFWMNDVSVIRISRCRITRGTLSGNHVLTLIWMIMNGGSFKIVSNWAVLTLTLLGTGGGCSLGMGRARGGVWDGRRPRVPEPEFREIPEHCLIVSSTSRD